MEMARGVLLNYEEARTFSFAFVFFFNRGRRLGRFSEVALLAIGLKRSVGRGSARRRGAAALEGEKRLRQFLLELQNRREEIAGFFKLRQTFFGLEEERRRIAFFDRPF